MIKVEALVFNPYQENTYILSDEQNNCIIVDPGMSNPNEEKRLLDYISASQLKPTALLNTHCHIDHVLGNHFVYEHWGLKPSFHEGEIPVLVAVQNYAPQMGFRYETSPIPDNFLNEGDNIQLGNDNLQVILAPGHSPAHLCFYSKEQNFLIGGDVLFYNSIGRTDLPGGNHDTLLKSIKEKIYTLPEETVVYPGHGPQTDIRFEKQTNPFVRG